MYCGEPVAHSAIANCLARVFVHVPTTSKICICNSDARNMTNSCYMLWGWIVYIKYDDDDGFDTKALWLSVEKLRPEPDGARHNA